MTFAKLTASFIVLLFSFINLIINKPTISRTCCVSGTVLRNNKKIQLRKQGIQCDTDSHGNTLSLLQGAVVWEGFLEVVMPQKLAEG